MTDHKRQNSIFLCFIPIVIVFAIAQSTAPAKTITLAFTNPNGTGDVYKLTFDTESISQDQLRALVAVSPHFAAYSAIAPSLEDCAEEDGRYYHPCGPGDLSDPNFFRNAQVNLNVSSERLASLDTLYHPEELEPVVDYEKKMLSFSVWLQQTRYEFYLSWNTDVLKTKYQALDSSRACAPAITQIEQAKSEAEKYKLARFNWHNCVLDAFRKQGGKYPLDAWRRFLNDYGIREKYIEATPPD